MTPEADIDAVRRALDLTAADEAVVREVAPRLAGEIEGWVDAFYARLGRDRVAQALLRDEGTVERLRRSLVSWFQELFSLPYDAAYERARAEIGRVHVRIGMPQHLMVTAMAGIRRDVRASIVRAFPGDPAGADRAVQAVEKALDLELALMLGAYRRRARELAQRTDRALYARHAQARVARARADAADAAMCYAALLRRARDAVSAGRWASRLSEALLHVGRDPGGESAEERALTEGPRRATIAEVCARAVADVSVPARTEVETIVDPPGARVVVHEVPLRLALEELVQNAVNRDPGGAARLVVTALADGGLLVEVSDGGARWPEGVHDVAEAVAACGGMPTAFTELVTGLHGGSVELVRPPGGGAAIRVRLRAVPEEEGSE
jgi:hypothetical protein